MTKAVLSSYLVCAIEEYVANGWYHLIFSEQTEVIICKERVNFKFHQSC